MNILKNAPRLVITGSGGDSGKTLATLGVIRAWRREGKTVQPFKKGPDYIDPAWLTRAAGRQTRNLDSYLMGWDGVISSFKRYAVAEGLNIIEGNRGLHDGEDSTGSHSTAALAKALGAPVILILPVVKVTRTAAAVVLGMKMLDPEVNLAGVILNQVAGARHEKVIRQAIQDVTGIPVLGAIPKSKDSPLAGRHLGLVTPQEHSYASKAIEQAADLITQYVDLIRLESVTANCSPLQCEAPTLDDHQKLNDIKALRIGWFTSSAFTFYYPENLEALTNAGAELIPINPLSDQHLPDIDALYIGGGFPETHSALLMGNDPLKAQLRKASEAGLPIWAECGGLMYLAKSIVWEGSRYEMAGVLPVEVEVETKPQGHGYVELTTDAPNPFFPAGTRLKGHEFHYSRVIPGSTMKTVFQVNRGVGVGGNRDGLTVNNTVAVYTHLHATASPAWAVGMIKAAENYRLQNLTKP